MIFKNQTEMGLKYVIHGDTLIFKWKEYGLINSKFFSEMGDISYLQIM